MPIKDKEYKQELCDEPYNFIQSLIYMNNYFEKYNIKTFNVFPSRHNIIPKHITIDTASMNVIFCNNRYTSIENNKKVIYKEIFKFPDSYFKMNNKYEFSGTIQTDGVSLTLLYLTAENYEKKIKINEKHNAKKDAFTIKKELKNLHNTNQSYQNKLEMLLKNKKENKKEILNVRKEISEINGKIKKIKEKQEEDRIEKNKVKKEKETKRKEEQKKEKEKKKEYIKKLKEENNTDELKLINRQGKEFYYITELTKQEEEELRQSKKLYIDQ